MTRIFNERFEGTGYNETWSDGETVDTGCDLDEDQSIAVAGNPAHWNALCLYADVVGATGDDAFVAGDLVNLSDEPNTWLRIEVVVVADGLDTDTNIARLLVVKDSADLLLYRISLVNDGGTLKIRCTAKLNGSDLTSYLSAGISIDTLYRIEVQWKTTTNEFAWRINDVLQDAAALTGSHALGIDEISALGLTAVTATKDFTVAIDNVAIDDKHWVGAGRELATHSNFGSRKRRRNFSKKNAGLEVTGDLEPDVAGDFVNIGPQAANGAYDPTEPDADVYQITLPNGAIWYLWHDSDGSENWMITKVVGEFNVRWYLTYVAGDPTGSYAAAGSASGTATVAYADVPISPWRFRR